MSNLHEGRLKDNLNTEKTAIDVKGIENKSEGKLTYINERDRKR